MIDKDPPLKYIKIDKLELWEEANVRKTDPYNELDDLTNNIKKVGLKNPLLVKGENSDGKYLVFSGQRRLMACTEAGLKEIPCFVQEKITIDEARALSLGENIYRLRMNYNDISDATIKLIEHYKSRETVANLLGVHENTVKRYLQYSALPQQIKDLVGSKKISARQAMDLYTKFPDQEMTLKIARELSRIKTRPQKQKYYYSAKYSKPKETISDIRKRAKKMKPFARYIIEVAPAESEIIQTLAIKRQQRPEEIIVDIIEKALDANSKGILEI